MGIFDLSLYQNEAQHNPMCLFPDTFAHCLSFCSQHDGTPYCHKPCYAALFGPKGEEHLTIVIRHTLDQEGNSMVTK